MIQLSLLRWLSFGRQGCRLGRERVWLYRIVLPNEESAKIIEQVDGNARAVRVIDDEVYARWKRLRFEFYATMKKTTILVERGLRLVYGDYRAEVEAYLRRVKAELEEIEREIWARMPPSLAKKLWDRESLHPGRNFRWLAIPVEICRDDLQRLIEVLQGQGDGEGGEA